MGQSERQVHITWHPVPPTPAQQQAWKWLWQRLLWHGEVSPERQKPQDMPSPAATTTAAARNGSHIVSEHNNDNRFDPHSK